VYEVSRPAEGASLFHSLVSFDPELGPETQQAILLSLLGQQETSSPLHLNQMIGFDSGANLFLLAAVAEDTTLTAGDADADAKHKVVVTIRKSSPVEAGSDIAELLVDVALRRPFVVSPDYEVVGQHIARIGLSSNTTVPAVQRANKMFGVVEGYRVAAVRTGRGGVALNVDFAPMMNQSLTELLQGAASARRMDFNPTSMSPSTQTLAELVIGVCVTTSHIRRAGVVRKLSFTLMGFSEKPANAIVLSDGEHEGMTIAEYFESRYGIRLQHPDWLCVDVTSPSAPPDRPRCYMPIELCQVKPGVRRNILAERQEAMLAASTLDPNVFLEKVKHVPTVLADDPILRKAGIVVAREPLTDAAAEVLSVPTVKFANQEIRLTSWNLRGLRLLSPGGGGKRWGFINLGDPQRADYLHQILRDQFVGPFVQTYGMNIDMSQGPAISATIRRDGRHLTEEIQTALAHCQKGSLAIVFIVLPDKETGRYMQAKRAFDHLEIPSQALQLDKVMPGRGNVSPQYVGNVALKVNLKMRGSNWTVNGLDFDRVMYVGIDIHHAPGKESDTKSLLACVATNKEGIQSAVLRETPPKQEVNPQVGEMLLEHLHAWSGRPEKEFPEEIVIVRDGCGRGLLEQLVDVELSSVRNALLSFGYAEDKLPYLAVLVSTKRHKIRFISRRGQNVDPGTVVTDDRVVHQASAVTSTNFYMVSHKGRLGTSKPIHYSVLVNNKPGRPDADLYQLLYNMCFGHQRSTQAVSMPFIVYSAHLAAERARLYVDDATETARRVERLPNFWQ
jgi:eukaryotic translation initiation factor 2C